MRASGRKALEGGTARATRPLDAAGTPQRSPQAGRSTQEDNFMDFDLSMGGNKKTKGKKGGQLQRNKGKKSRQWWCLFLCRM